MEKVEKKSKVKKIFGIVRNVIFYIFLALCAFAVVMSLASKKDSTGAVNIFGHQMLFVRSDSMGKSEFTDVSDYDIGSIPVRSMILIETVPEDPEAAAAWYDDIEIGDVLTIRYTYTTQETITHRVTDKQEKDGGYIITLKGDNKTDENADTIEQTIDTTQADTSFNYIVGKVVWHNYPLGLLIYAVKQPVGIVGLVIVPCLIIIIFEIIRVVNAFGAEKKKKYAEEKAQTNSELEELRRRLEELQRQTEANANAQTNNQPQEIPPTTQPPQIPESPEVEVAQDVASASGEVTDEPTSEQNETAQEVAKEETTEDIQPPVETPTQDAPVSDEGEDEQPK